jgi:hypothetical protein
MSLEAMFERRTLLEAVNSPDLKVKPRFVIDNVFPTATPTFSDVADFEVESARNTLAGFRPKGAPAKVVGTIGKVVKTVKMPYIREKKVLTARQLRAENTLGNVYISGSGDLATARAKALAKELQDLKNRISRRVEWMGCQLLTGGKFQYEDDEIAFELDLGMTSTFKPALSGTSIWGGSAADILGNLDAWNILMDQATGTFANRAIMGTNAARAFMKDPNIQKQLDTNNQRIGSMSIDLKSNYLGNIYGIDFFRYSHQYTNDAGSAADMFDANKVVLLGADIPADLLYGTVEEVDQDFAGEFFSKSWVTEDPSERWLLAASRPLPVLKQIGSWISATVIA